MASDMTVQPLPRHLLERAKELGVEIIELDFNGGSDEGHLNVHVGKKLVQDEVFKPVETPHEWLKFGQDIDEWAWSVYEYSGAGEGDDYGDDIVYDLIENKVTTHDWYMERTEGDDTETALEIAQD